MLLSGQAQLTGLCGGCCIQQLESLPQNKSPQSTSSILIVIPSSACREFTRGLLPNVGCLLCCRQQLVYMCMWCNQQPHRLSYGIPGSSDTYLRYLRYVTPRGLLELLTVAGFNLGKMQVEGWNLEVPQVPKERKSCGNGCSRFPLLCLPLDKLGNYLKSVQPYILSSRSCYRAPSNWFASLFHAS